MEAILGGLIKSLMGSDKIIELLLGLGISFLGWRWIALKNVIKQINEFLTEFEIANADDKLTKAEREVLVKELKDIPVAIKALIGRKKN